MAHHLNQLVRLLLRFAGERAPGVDDVVAESNLFAHIPEFYLETCAHLARYLLLSRAYDLAVKKDNNGAGSSRDSNDIGEIINIELLVTLFGRLLADDRIINPGTSSM